MPKDTTLVSKCIICVLIFCFLTNGPWLYARTPEETTQKSDEKSDLLTFTKDGVTSSFGKSLKFIRDSRGYITAIQHNGETLVKYTIDALGDLTSTSILENVVDGVPKYNTTEYTYINHNVSKITDPRGITPIINEYDPATGRLIAHTDAFGKRIVYEHRIAAREEVVYDRNFNPTIYGYNTDGLVTRITDAQGNPTTRDYDANKNLIAEANALNQTTRWTYNNKGLPTSITDPLGNKQEMTYNEFGQVLTRKDARGNIWREEYDDKGNNIRSIDPLGGETKREFSDNGLLKAVIDPLGVRSEYVHNQFGWVVEELVKDPTGNLLRKTTNKYDDIGNQLSRTIWARNTSGLWVELATWENVFDKQGRVVKAIDPNKYYTETIYNSIGKPAKVIDKNLNPIEYEYDAMGQLVKIKYPDGTYDEYGYDDNGNRIWFRDRSGRITRYRYDSLNRLVMTIYPDNSYTETKYNAIGQVISTIDERGSQWQHEYDAAGRKTADIDPYFKRTEYKLDPNGNQIEVKDANNNITKAEYDKLNRPIKITYPDNTFKTIEYDKAGRKIAETDQAGLTTKYLHDFLGQLIEVHDAELEITKYVWDDVGNKIADIDAEGRTTKYEHDMLGRLKKKTLPGGQFEQWGYDANGNVTWHKDYNGQAINYAFDSNDRMKTKTYQDGTEVRYTYTGTGKVETITEARGVTRRYYDERDRLRQEDDPTTGTIQWSHDSAGNITSMWTNFIAVYTTYDKLNRPVEVRDGNGITYIGYDNVGNRISETKPNGTVTTYTHNSLNRLTNITTKDRMGKVIASYAYELGPAGNRLSVTELDGSKVSYQYDRVYRLLRETRVGTNAYDRSYTYDKVGNRLTKNHNGVITNYRYNSNDWLTSETTNGVTTTYTHDNNGSLTRKQSPTETVDYAYNQEKQLIQATSNVGGTMRYWYADDGIRVTSQVNGVSTFYLVDRNNLTGFAQVIGELDSAGNATVLYTYGDDLISQTRTSGVRFYHYDGQMSTRLLTDAGGGAGGGAGGATAGAVTDTYTYYAFGELLAQTGTTPNNYLYTGEQWDPNVGFYYLRARYYNPAIGRFLTVDPVVGSIFEPASLHKYVYVLNNPVNLKDPNGEFAISGLADLLVTAMIRGIFLLQQIPLIGKALAFFLTFGLNIFLVAGGRLIQITAHTAKRMIEKGVSLEQLESLVQRVNPFRYFHEGVWKLGYYDPVTKLFAAEYRGVILTVITDVVPRYIQSLISKTP